MGAKKLRTRMMGSSKLEARRLEARKLEARLEATLYSILKNHLANNNRLKSGLIRDQWSQRSRVRGWVI